MPWRLCVFRLRHRLCVFRLATSLLRGNVRLAAGAAAAADECVLNCRTYFLF